jgi:hypothetical protein
MTAPIEEPGGSICVGCGFCCDGTLHAAAIVRHDDAKNVAAAGLVIEDDGDRRFFSQPCVRFSCGSCSVYTARPDVCRRYRCALLTNVEAGKISPSVARRRIARAIELRTAVRDVEPNSVTPADRSALAARLLAEVSKLEGDDRQTAARALLATAAFNHCLDRWFFKNEEDKANPEETTDPRRFPSPH